VVGVPGARVADLADLRLAAAHRLLIVELGTNDWLGYVMEGPWSSTPLEQFSPRYERLLDRLLAPGAALVCLGIWGPRGGRSETGSVVDDYDAAIARECCLRGGRFFSLADLHDDDSLRGPAGRRTPFGISDEVHPNDRGHRRLAGIVLEACGVPPPPAPERPGSQRG
jgi:lysophospholipase L1-like esterase